LTPTLPRPVPNPYVSCILNTAKPLSESTKRAISKLPPSEPTTRAGSYPKENTLSEENEVILERMYVALKADTPPVATMLPCTKTSPSIRPPVH